MEVGTL